MPGPTNPALQMEDVIAGVQGSWARLHQINNSLAQRCFPQGAPTQADQFNAKMSSLGLEIRCIEKLDLESLRSLLDDSEFYISLHVKKTIGDIFQVATEFRRLFESSYYGRWLNGELGQYVVELERLQWLDEMANRRPNQIPRAVDQPQTQRSPKFCKGALQLINHDDKGALERLPSSRVRDLSTEDRAKISDGGFYVYWKCTSCAFKIRYLVKSSKTSTISTTDLVRKHSGIEYRPSFLVKSHLPQRHPDSSHKYSCLFCCAEGRSSDTYNHGTVLMQHIQSSHNRTYPARFFLEKMNIKADRVFLPPKPFDIRLTGT